MDGDQTMTTTVSVSPPPVAEVRGRALGVTLLAFFALAWVGWARVDTYRPPNGSESS